MAKLWPSNSCTVVVARRVVNAGSTAVRGGAAAVVMPMPSRFSSDTSGATFRLMRPPSSTVGVNLTAMPNSFSSSVILLVPLLSCATGMKILPPARKLASWPLMAMMFGSASTFTRPSRFCASSVTPLPFLPLNAAEQAGVAAEQVRQQAVAPVAARARAPTLAPSWSTRVFDTSAIFTSSITCCGAAIVSILITLHAAARRRRHRRQRRWRRPRRPAPPLAGAALARTPWPWPGSGWP